MPKREETIKKREYFTIIPEFTNYLLSNRGDVIYKTTGKKRSVFKRENVLLCRITNDAGKTIAVNITKKLAELFPLSE